METCCYVVSVSAVELGQSSESGWIYTSAGNLSQLVVTKSS